MLILTREGMYAARDKFGRTPLILGKKDGAYCAASESFAFINIGYEYEKELGAGEIEKFFAFTIDSVRRSYENNRYARGRAPL